ncbi:MAG: hypothetical protein NC078_12755 [Ruminococcus sp.]|nr:hypothetical protein [Ruminococcus sp.]
MNLVKKKAVVVHDEAGLPNYMTMFYMEPLLSVTPDVKVDVPEMFRVDGKTVAAVLISQYTNVMMKDIPASLPYQKPAESMNFDEAAAACRRKGHGWHLMTNTEWVYLMKEAEEIGHKIGGNTNYGKNADNPEEKGWCYDGYTVLTGTEPQTWSHDGTPGGVFGLCGNFWEWVAGLRLHNGAIEYIPDNNAASFDYMPEDPAWTVARTEEPGEEGLPFGKPLYLDAQCGKVVLTDGEIAGSWTGCRMKELQLAGSLKEVPEIIHRLGILPQGWQQEKAGIWVDSSESETVPFRGSCFDGTSNGGVSALRLNGARSHVYYRVSFRSALYLEDWQLVTELL